MKNLSEFHTVCGVYVLRNKVDDISYVGQSENIDARISEHIKKLTNGKHHNDQLLSDFQKYGIDGFDFTVMEECEKAKLLEREKWWCVTLYRNGVSLYNVMSDKGMMYACAKSVDEMENNHD